jgi:limonene-1,2-epoxide hydrolase
MGTNIDIVNDFLSAYWASDEDQLAKLTRPEFVWDNVAFHQFKLVGEQFERTDNFRHGTEGLGTANTLPIDPGSGRHEIISETERGDVVYQERFDRVRIKGSEIEMMCCGVFRVEKGQVVLWRDYFDFSHWTGQLAQLGVEFDLS